MDAVGVEPDVVGGFEGGAEGLRGFRAVFTGVGDEDAAGQGTRGDGGCHVGGIVAEAGRGAGMR